MKTNNMGDYLIELSLKIKVEISNENTFQLGINNLLELREHLFGILIQLKGELSQADFNAMPFIGADGFHSKTIAYSIWHIFRIEDIIVHTLVCRDKQIFFSADFQKRIGSPIITTGNELIGHQISEFSKSLDIEELYQYASLVKDSTDRVLKNLTFADLKREIAVADKWHLKSLNVVSQTHNAQWLIDYWCGEDMKGFIIMPFSEHWLAHIYACMIIRNKLLS